MIHKVVSSLPSTLLPSQLYFVRVGDGFDFYFTDNGSVPFAQKLNTGLAVLDAGTAVYQKDSEFIYRAWERTDGTGYEAVKYSLATGQSAGEFSGVLPIVSDLSTLTYT